MEIARMRVLAEEILAAWTSQDVESVLACYTDDLLYSDPNTNGPVSGQGAMRRYLEKLFASWTMQWTLREIHRFDDGEGCSVLWRASFQRKSGGPTSHIDGMDLVVLRGDRVHRNVVVFDRSALPTKS